MADIDRKPITRQCDSPYAVEGNRPIYGIRSDAKKLKPRHFSAFQKRLIVATFAQHQSCEDAARELRENMDPRFTARLVVEVALLDAIRKQPAKEEGATVRESLSRVVSIKRAA